MLKISNSSDGPADYVPADYLFAYRDPVGGQGLRWRSDHHPAVGTTYYVTWTTGGGAKPVPATDFEVVDATMISGTFEVRGAKLAVKTAPPATQAIVARFIGAGADYEQTVNGLGGLAAVQPDGPGYPMRTYNVGLALRL